MNLSHVFLSFSTGVALTSGVFLALNNRADTETTLISGQQNVATSRSSSKAMPRIADSSQSAESLATANNTRQPPVSENVEIDVLRVSTKAREQLGSLEKAHRLTDSERESLRSAILEASPEERESLLSKYRQKVMDSQLDYESSLSSEEKSLRKRYQILSKLDGMLRVVQRFSGTSFSASFSEGYLEKLHLIAVDGEYITLEKLEADWSELSQMRSQLLAQHHQHQQNIRLAAQSNESQ